jgi:DnaK suppressor protein
MLSREDIRKKLLTQRRDLFRQAAQTEEELLWFETDIESEVQERGQEENMVRLLDRLDGRMKAEIEAIDQALVRIDSGQYGRCEACGKDIPQSRLEALPATAVCMGCAEAAESRAALRK